jgi:hypothetical protein
MALYDELPVFKAAYDLLLDIYRFSATLTREYKYTLGEKLKNETLEMPTHRLKHIAHPRKPTLNPKLR